MSDLRSNRADLFEQIHELVTARINDELTPEQFERLDTLLSENDEARRLYVQYVYETLALPSLLGVDDPSATPSDSPPLGDGAGADDSAFAESGGMNDDSLHIVVKQSALQRQFVGSPLFSYSAALLILCAMLLSAWAYKVTHYRHIAADDTKETLPDSSRGMQFVGKVTGMKDCRWTDPNTAPYGGSSVPLGRQYALDSGLLEITYKTGARVILEGPCHYTVDSDAGGRLALGKLVARVEKRERGEGTDGLAALAASVKPQAANPQPPAPNPRSPAPLFSVTTPSAVVTDLGTEFGVEVTENGDTVSHVFQGTVEVRAISAHTVNESVELPKTTRLTAGQTARVNQSDSGESTSLTKVAGDRPAFVRRLNAPPKQLDLLDIVAGGDGLGVHRERGIDPATGKQDSYFLRDRRTAQQQYTPVSWNRFVDGVFIPMYGEAPPGVQLDSAGHAYDGFAIFKYKSAPMRRTVGSVWARAADVNEINKSKNRWFWIYTVGAGEQFMPERKGLLCTRANVGITFDLKALRTAHEGASPSLFHAIAGLADASEIMADKNPEGMADLWVFVDGKIKQRRLKLRPQDGPVEMNVELGPSDRFLTLATTDSADGSNFDWVVWGDPTLEMTVTNKDRQPDKQP